MTLYNSIKKIENSGGKDLKVITVLPSSVLFCTYISLLTHKPYILFYIFLSMVTMDLHILSMLFFAAVTKYLTKST